MVAHAIPDWRLRRTGIFTIVADYFAKYGIPQIDAYLDANVRSGSMSAKYDNMCSLLGKFDKKWSETFKKNVSSRTDGSKIIQASVSLVTNRHAFAHGNAPSATFDDIVSYYNDVLELIKEFDAVVT